MVVVMNLEDIIISIGQIMRTFTTTVNQNVHVTVQDKYKVSYDEKVKSIKDTINETMNDSEDLNHLYINLQACLLVVQHGIVHITMPLI